MFGTFGADFVPERVNDNCLKSVPNAIFGVI